MANSVSHLRGLTGCPCVSVVMKFVRALAWRLECVHVQKELLQWIYCSCDRWPWRIHAEIAALREECKRISKADLVNVRRRVPARAHGDNSLGNRKRIAMSPIPRGIHPNAFGSMHFHNVNGARRGALGVGIQRHARPHSAIKHHAHCVLFNMVNQNTRGIYFSMRGNGIQNKARAFQFVLQVRRMNENQ